MCVTSLLLQRLVQFLNRGGGLEVISQQQHLLLYLTQIDEKWSESEQLICFARGFVFDVAIFITTLLSSKTRTAISMKIPTYQYNLYNTLFLSKFLSRQTFHVYSRTTHHQICSDLTIELVILRKNLVQCTSFICTIIF